MVTGDPNIDPIIAGEREYLSPLEFVLRSGLSIATVRRRLRDGRLPKFQPGGPRSRVLIPVAALKPFVEKAVSIGTQSSGTLAASLDRQSRSKRPIPGPPPRWRSQT